MGRSSRACPRCRELERELDTLRRAHERELTVLRAVHEAALADLRAELRALRDEVGDLRARLKLTSRNSSKPPSSDPPGTKRDRRPPSGGRPGGQPGHEGTTRRRFSPEEVDARQELHPERCHNCGGSLDGALHGDAPPVVHQVVDIPPVTAFVTEYVLHRGVCPHCGVLTKAPLPPEVSWNAVGPRLQAVLAALTGRYRLSRREAVELAVCVFGSKAEVGLGTLSELEARTAAALETVYREVAAAVCRAHVVHADETSFRQAGHKSWLWTACTNALSFFRIDKERSRAASERLLPDYGGILVTDRWNSYHHHPAERRQLCWAHLKRNAQELVDRGSPASAVGRAVFRAADAVFGAYEGHCSGKLTLPCLARRLAPAKKALERALRRGLRNADRKAAAFSKDVLKLFESLWTFTRHAGVPPTNNLAEREIRPAVLWRKGSFGCQSPRGARFVERMLTATRTLRRQGRNVLDFLEATIKAAHTGRPAPTLLTP